jgi:hypothetical protein
VWIDRGLILVREIGGESRLSIWGDDDFTDIATVKGSSALVAAGNKVAVRVSGDGESAGGVQAALRTQTLPTLAAGRVSIIDLDTLQVDTVTTEPTALFQWDLTGEVLLIATASPNGLVWTTWTDGSADTLGTYRPNPQWVTDLVPFFDQYAQSVSFWNADGSRIVVGPDLAGSVFTGSIGSVSLEPIDLDAVWVASAR